ESSFKDWIQQHPQNFEVKNLKLIFNNLKGMNEQFEQLQYAQPFNETLNQNKQEHLNLLDDDIQVFSDLVLKLRQQLTPQSALFRHAILIAVVFAAGYAISLLPFAQH
ncbi:TIGR01666 family membrane protein, partial [Acinetobacter baumannii]